MAEAAAAREVRGQVILFKGSGERQRVRALRDSRRGGREGQAARGPSATRVGVRGGQWEMWECQPHTPERCLSW